MKSGSDCLKAPCYNRARLLAQLVKGGSTYGRGSDILHPSPRRGPERFSTCIHVIGVMRQRQTEAVALKCWTAEGSRRFSKSLFMVCIVPGWGKKPPDSSGTHTHPGGACVGLRLNGADAWDVFLKSTSLRSEMFGVGELLCLKLPWGCSGLKIRPCHQRQISTCTEKIPHHNVWIKLSSYKSAWIALQRS